MILIVISVVLVLGLLILSAAVATSGGGVETPVFVLSVIACLFAVCVGLLANDRLWQQQMIDAGCAEYNRTTGYWQWTGEVCNPGEAFRGARDAPPRVERKCCGVVWS